MTDYILDTSVGAEDLHPVFEESVRGTCLADYSSRQINAWVERATLARWQELISGSLHFIAVVHRLSGDVAGFTSVSPEGYVHSMFVRPSHQHKGVASLLLSEAEKFARKFRAVKLYSEVSITAYPFFLSKGFEKQREQIVTVNGIDMNNFLMVKPLLYRPEEKDYDELVQVWEDSVRTTHHFLSEEDIQYYKPLVRLIYLPAVDLYCFRNEQGQIAAFMGLSEELIEMLFVAPGEQGKGYGSRLIDFAVREKHLYRVDVNEQNTDAFRFYRRKGFEVVSRDALDGSGRPFPILHLKKKESDEE